MKIVNNIFLVVLATMLFVQVNCKRGNDYIVHRSELNQNGEKITHSMHTEYYTKSHTTGTQTHTEHGVETNESKTESKSPKETSIKKEKYKVMFFTYKPRKVKDQTHGNKNSLTRNYNN